MHSPAQHSDLFARDVLRDKRKRAVILAAAAAFNRYGFHKVSMEDIAASLGTSKPTLYQLFPNKQKLFYACHQYAMDHGEAGLALAKEHDGTGLDRLLIYIRRYLEGIIDDLGGCAVLTDVSSLLAEDRKAAVARRSRISAATRSLIEAGQRDGSIRETDPKLATLFLLGAVNWALIWYRPGGERSPGEIIDEYMSLIGNTLGTARPKRAKRPKTGK